jgi:hypothetical protein
LPPPAAPARPPPPAQQQAAPPIPALNPVVKFGETDSGPRQSLEGSAAEDEKPTQAQAEKPIADEARRETPAEEKPQPAETETAQSPEKPGSDAPGQPEGKAEEGASGAQLVAPAAEAEAAPPAPHKPVPAKTATAPEPRLHEARTLFSRSANRRPSATTAMAGIPRGVRVGRLCATELRLQLQNGPASYLPDLLPSYELASGTVLKVRHAAFRALGTWYNLSFECQVNAEATNLVSFAFRVGEPLSRDEQQRRGLPSR